LDFVAGLHRFWRIQFEQVLPPKYSQKQNTWKGLLQVFKAPPKHRGKLFVLPGISLVKLDRVFSALSPVDQRMHVDRVANDF
jgi:hypothetical protein